MRFQHESFIAASPERVFAFHEAPGALEKLVPPWEHVRVVQRGTSLAPGTVVIMKMRIGPVWVTWEAVHTLYEKDVLFQDKQRSGPFARWIHTHRFLAAPGGMRLVDEVDYELPLGKLGQLFGGATARKKLERMFEFRHEVTRKACAL